MKHFRKVCAVLLAVLMVAVMLPTFLSFESPSVVAAGAGEVVNGGFDTYESYTGLKGECLAIGGGTYVHSIEGGVAFGCAMPGTDNRMHGADEFAVIEELMISAKMFTQIILELCK